MKNSLLEEIPSLDLADFQSEDNTKKEQFVQDLGKAYEEIGFVAIKNHGLSDALQKSLYQAIEAFFQLPVETKTKYEIKGLAGQRGYVGRGKEHAKGRSVGDLKEFYHIGQELSPEELDKEGLSPNFFPEELETFKETTVETFNIFQTTGKTLLRAIALYLDLEEDYFETKVHNGNSILRAIHYYPIDNPDSLSEGAVRAAAHGDINLITLLMGASAEGLEVQRRDGAWIPITALPDQIVVNVGDMLDRLTNHKLKSTIHRVVNPPKEKMKTSRYSIPFFMHPRSEMDLTSLESCVNTENPKQYSDMTAGEFLQERLAEIGLKK